MSIEGCSEMRRLLVVLMSIGLGLSGQAGSKAADSKGRYAISGAGTLTCERFREAQSTDVEDYRHFGSWMSGYFTAFNEISDDTFAIIPWQSADLIALIVHDYCGKNPESRFAHAIGSIAKTLYDQRLRESSTSLAFDDSGAERTIYKEVLLRAQSRLASAGFYSITPNGRLDDLTRAALEAYQSANELEVTGLPNQDTLWHLFYGP